MSLHEDIRVALGGLQPHHFSVCTYYVSPNPSASGGTSSQGQQFDAAKQLSSSIGDLLDTVRLSRRAPAAKGVNVASVWTTPDTLAAHQRIKEKMSPDGLKGGSNRLRKMAEAIEPILKSFDGILVSFCLLRPTFLPVSPSVQNLPAPGFFDEHLAETWLTQAQPHIDHFVTQINTVPVVGLKDNRLVYVETVESTSGSNNQDPNSGLEYKWSEFCSLPSDATIQETDSVHLFPYQGNFFLSIGRAVWQMDARTQADLDKITEKGHHPRWPEMYTRQWKKLDTVLPADTCGVAPYIEINKDQARPHLLVLAKDGTLSYMEEEHFASNPTFSTLSFKTKNQANSAPQLKRITCLSNVIVGLDNSSHTWDLKLDFDQKTYTVADGVQVAPMTEFTATEQGLVGLKEDGYLYRRIVKAPSDESGATSLPWTRWIAADGATNLGVASPGAILNLKLVIQALRRRYIETQTALYPAVEKIRTFSRTHLKFLANVQKAAEEFKAAGNDDAKKKIAIEHAQTFVSHYKLWGKVVSDGVAGGNATVNAMVDQMDYVHSQIEAQLKLLKSRLGELEDLQKRERDEWNAKVTMWLVGSIAAIFVGKQTYFTDLYNAF
jgi:hypothetical protein